jgi:hypothetical protein
VKAFPVSNGIQDAGSPVFLVSHRKTGYRSPGRIPRPSSPVALSHVIQTRTSDRLPDGAAGCLSGQPHCTVRLSGNRPGQVATARTQPTRGGDCSHNGKKVRLTFLPKSESGASGTLSNRQAGRSWPRAGGECSDLNTITDVRDSWAALAGVGCAGCVGCVGC